MACPQHLLQNTLSQQGTHLWDGYVNMLKVLSSIFLSPRHWVLEFLQNAEDAQAHVFAIVAGEDFLWVLNDGAPFSQKDLRAICDVNSYKLPQLGFRGYIGIGFKSIFRITNLVEVHSGDYHFKFDKGHWQAQGNNVTRWPWEVLPLPVDPRPFPEGFEGFSTGFYIPMPSEKGRSTLDELRHFFTVEFPKEALLQLRHVKEVRIITSSGSCALIKESKSQWELIPGVLQETAVVKKVSLADGQVVEEDPFLVVRKEVLVPPEVRADEETERVKRSGVHKREIGLVFRLDARGIIDLLHGRITGVYSFLPLEGEQTGLPFGIFGDFIPQPGRDLINYQAIWNRWLCGEIVELFKSVVSANVGAYPEWITVPPRVLEGLRETGGPGEDFWKQNLREPVQKYLVSEALYRDQQNRLRRLDELVIVKDEIVQAVGKDPLEQATGRFFPHPHIKPLLERLRNRLPHGKVLFVDDVYDLLKNWSLLDSLRNLPEKLASLYRLIRELSDYDIGGRGGRDVPLRGVPFVLSKNGEFYPPSSFAVARLEEIPNVPSFLIGEINRMREEAKQSVAKKLSLHPVIENDTEAVEQLARCGLEVHTVSGRQVFGAVKGILDRVTRPDQCPNGWRFPDDLIEATVFLLYLAKRVFTAYERAEWSLSYVVAHDGNVSDPRFLFTPGARLDWNPLWVNGYLPTYYKPVHSLYLSDALLTKYGLTVSDIHDLLERTGVHGFDASRDRELIEEAAYRVAESRLRSADHLPERVTGHTRLGYDYQCQHCQEVYEVKGMKDPKDITLEGSEADACIDKKSNYILICVYNLPCPPNQIGYKEIRNPQGLGSMEARIIIGRAQWLYV